MILNFDRGFGQTPEQMVQSLMESVQMALDTTERKLSEAGIDISSDGGSISLIDMVYPIGAIYISVNDVSPETFLGGTWERIKDSFILAAGDTYEAGSTGGEAEVTLTQAEIPNHTHLPQGTGRRILQYNYADVSAAGVGEIRVTAASSGTNYVPRVSNANVDFMGADYTGYVNGDNGGSHNNMPPYVTAYVWKRTA